MATVAARKKPTRRYGPRHNGILMTPREFDRAEFVEGWRYELINGVLVVSITPLRNERDPNDELGWMLREYKRNHPLGWNLDATVPEEEIATMDNRRRVDRAIWAGLGRLPRKREKPTIAVEFVSEGRRNQERDYEVKRDEYVAINVQEYWILDRFERTMTEYFRQGRKRVLRERQVYKTDLLPGFELPLAYLFEVANRWPDEDDSANGGR